MDVMVVGLLNSVVGIVCVELCCLVWLVFGLFGYDVVVFYLLAILVLGFEGCGLGCSCDLDFVMRYCCDYCFDLVVGCLCML